MDIADLSIRAVEKYGSITKASKETGISESKLKKYHGMKGLVKELKDKIGSLGTEAVPSIEAIRKLSSLPETKQIEAFEAIKGKPRAQAEKILNRIGKTELSDEKAVEKAIILLEVPIDVHENLVLQAKKAQTSLEEFCAQTLQNQSLQNAANRGS